MAGYIGAKVGTVTANAADIKGDISSTDTSPDFTLKNTTQEDSDGGRESTITFKGEQTGGEESTLAEIRASHDGTADDEKADLIFKTNDGSDGASPTERMRIDSNGSILTATLGTDNVHLGEGAGDSIASAGNNNVTIGKNAGTAITTGDNNVAVGFEALSTEDANGNSTALGYRALKTQNAGAESYNTAVGVDAGLSVTTGVSNTIVGGLAGDALTVGGHNVAMGYEALSTDTKGSHSTAIGRRALKTQNFTSATDSHNTAIGNNAGTAVTTGANNTIVGSNVGSTMNTGYDNTFVGASAGESLTSGYSNTFVGKTSGQLVTGNLNTIVGRYDGNQGNLDIRTSSNNIVLSDGAGTPRVHDNGTQFKVLGNSQNNGICTIDNASTNNPYGAAITFSTGDPNNTTEYFLNCSSTGGVKAQIKSNGNLQNANNSYGSYSDQKLKENIVDSGSQWDDIKAVRVRKFSLKTDKLDAPNKLGVIAQELEASGMNGLVTTETDIDEETRENLGTETKSVQYSVLYMKAVKALQEAMARIETLETKVAELEAE